MLAVQLPPPPPSIIRQYPPVPDNFNLYGIPLRMAMDGVYEIVAVDLFCGAGGTSTGLVRAVERLQKRYGVEIRLILTAVNHWPVAIETHSANHSFAQHRCNGLTGVNPRDVVAGLCDLLVASPECTHHSTARGGRPMENQSRSSGDDVVRWIGELLPKTVLIENVREYMGWGPLVQRHWCQNCNWKGPETRVLAHIEKHNRKIVGLNGKSRCVPEMVVPMEDKKHGGPWLVPDPDRKGEFFDRFLAQIRALGYTIDKDLLCSADFGDPTTRLRLYVMCKRRPGPVRWPVKTHAEEPGDSGLLKWLSAREHVIDWSDRGKSIFNRKTPLKPNTMRRIGAGMLKFSGLDLRDFLVKLYGTAGAVSSALPAPTITGGGNHIYVVQPFMLGQQSGGAPRSTEGPTPTVPGGGAISKLEAFITANFNERPGQEPRVHSIDGPPPTVTPRGMGDFCNPFAVEYYGTGGPMSLDGPVEAVTGKDHFGLVNPSFMMSAGGPVVDPRSTDDPAHTVIGRDHIAVVSSGISEADALLASSFTMALTHKDKPGEDPAARTRSVELPMQTITGANRGEIGIVSFQIVKYTHNILTTPPQNGLLITFEDGSKWLIDIFFRMFRKRELARAQGFPDSYIFKGKNKDIVKQIGNAVSIETATALCEAAVTQ